MRVRKANDRGVTNIDWLYSRHSFSFGEYYDPKHMGFRSLRVINDDIIKRGAGFGMHGHRDMEIVTIVVDGELEHKDSLGHGEVLRPGEVQVMSAGRGIRHSEFNPSKERDAHIIQIWIEPRESSLPPSYGQREFPIDTRQGRLVRVAGPQSGSDNALLINQDANVYVASLSSSDTIPFIVGQNRGVWIHVIKGSCSINDTPLTGGDAAAFDGREEIRLTGGNEPSEIIFFDLP